MQPNHQNKTTFLGYLSTIGRVTGKTRTVKLRFVFLDGKFYASRRDSNANWLKNILKNPNVVIRANDREISGYAQIVKDQELAKKISELKYTDKKKKEEPRVVIEITPK
jgi:hypothetical protein